MASTSVTSRSSQPILEMGIRDRIVCGQPVLGVFGPLQDLSRDAVVGAVRSLAARRPASRIAWSYSGGRWYDHGADLDRFCDEMVTAHAPVSRESALDLSLRLVPTISPRHPIRLILAAPYLIQVSDHVLGDGDSFVKRLHAVTALAMDPTQELDWFSAREAPSPMRSALTETFLRKPSTVRDLLRGRQIAHRAPRQPPTFTAKERAWQPQRALVHSASPKEVHLDLKKWIRDAGPTTTMSSAYSVILHRAFCEAGIDTDPQQTVLIDLRRYLPSGTGEVTGSFIAGLSVPNMDSATPDDVGHALHEELNAGYPLAALAAGELMTFGHPRPRPIPRTVSTRPRARIVFSNVGLSRGLQRLPWAGPVQERTCALMGDPSGPESVTIQLVILDGTLHLTAAFHSNVHDAQAVERALQIAVQSPLDLLGVSRGVASSRPTP